MTFRGVLRGVEHTDAKEFAAAVKAEPPLEPFNRGGKPVKVGLTKLPAKPKPLFVAPRVTLTQPEREWLGATVRDSDGRIGQVWSLAPSKPGAPLGLWLVAGGEAFRADAGSVSFVEGVDNLPVGL